MSKALNILIIDDDPAVLAILDTRLSKKDGHKVTVATSGYDGLKLARKKIPDVILLDWMMPEMTGLKVLERLRVDDKTARTSVFMLTSKAKMTDVEYALECGATGYFTKPLRLSVMSSRLARLSGSV